ncbi:hypothetical protein RFI_08832, partial [Reticulomyxa filosa]
MADVPVLKHRMCQVLSFVYHKLRSTGQRSGFIECSLQLLPTLQMACDVCRTHNLLDILMTRVMHVLCNTTSYFVNEKASNHNAFEFVRGDKQSAERTSKAKFEEIFSDGDGDGDGNGNGNGNGNGDLSAEMNDFHYFFTNPYVIMFMFSQRPYLVDKWCQLLCLCQNVQHVHREIGFYDVRHKQSWTSTMKAMFTLSKFSGLLIMHVYHLLQSSSHVSAESRQHVRQTLVDIIRRALPMVEWKQWKSLSIASGGKKEVVTVVRTSHNPPTIVLDTFQDDDTVDMPLFRVDRDHLSIFLPLSRFIVDLTAVYCQTFCLS